MNSEEEFIMKKSVEILKSQATKEQFEKLINLYTGSEQVEKIINTNPSKWEVLELILFLDPGLNRKVIKEGGWWYQITEYFGVTKWDPECGYHYIPSEKDGLNYDSLEDPNYIPDLFHNYDKLSDKAVDKLIGHSKKLKNILTIINN